MSTPIFVGVDDSPGADAAVRWAVDDARARDLPLRLVYVYHWEHTRILGYLEVPNAHLRASREVAYQVVARAIDRVYELDAHMDVEGDAVEGNPAQVLIEASEYAAELVLGSRQLKPLGPAVLGSVSAAASARAACPAVVVRGPVGMPVEGAGVVVGVDGTEASETVLGFGFEYARRHGVPLRPVLCWHPDQLALMIWRAEPPALARVEAWLSEVLAGWWERYPDVAVRPEVIREHSVAGLLAASAGQRLLVVGSHGRHALAGTLLGSVSQGVLHHATCPVAVVPTHRG